VGRPDDLSEGEPMSRDSEVREAIEALWAWAVRAGPFIEATLVLAEDKGPALNLLADAPALREKVLAILDTHPSEAEGTFVAPWTGEAYQTARLTQTRTATETPGE
jgi:hypothetical protein